MLAINNIEVVYDGVILVLKGVSIDVREGGITTLLGANGAGKTTTLKAISGVLRTERGDVTKGSVELDGQRLDRLRPYEVVQRGVVQVFEGRRVFEHLTTEENLVAGAHIQRDAQKVGAGIERVYQYFPRLKERRAVQAGYLSGGEQKLTVLLVEQNAVLALGIAEHGYVMESGRIVLEGSAEALRGNADIKEFYLGLTEVGARKSYRDVKHYKRRKRWLS